MHAFLWCCPVVRSTAFCRIRLYQVYGAGFAGRLHPGLRATPPAPCSAGEAIRVQSDWPGTETAGANTCDCALGAVCRPLVA